MKYSLPDITPEQKFFVLNIITGLAAGAVAILLHQSIHYLMQWFGTDNGFTLKSWLLGGLSLLAGSFISTKVMPECAGSGIPRTKILISVHHGIIRTKEWIVKIGTTVLSLSSGVPLGSEGPTIAISAGIGSSLGRRFKLKEKRVKELVYAGCSAGIAAAFNTPIAAVIFTMEEIIGNTNAKSMGPILISSLVASVTAAALIGQNSVFTPVHYSFDANVELFFYLGLGIVAGVAGPLFINNIIITKKLTLRFFKHHRFTAAIFAFILVGGLSQFVQEVPGNGLGVINNLLQGKVSSWEVLSALLVFKFIACAICYGAGMSGGILMPVLFLGAALGGLFGAVAIHILNLSEVQIGAYCLVGMGAFFASVIKTPFTSVILVFEMTRDYRIVMPLMLANLVAYLISEKIGHGSIYERVAMFEGYELPTHEEEDALIQGTVELIYKKSATIITEKELDFIHRIYPDQSLSFALVKLKRLGSNQSLKVVNRFNTSEVLGEISLNDIFEYLAQDTTSHQ